MTLKKLLLVIAGGLGVLGAFLPWYKVSVFGFSMSKNAFGMEDALLIILAILALLCSVATILLNVLPEKQIKNIIKIKALDKLPFFISIAMTAIAVIAFIYIKVKSEGVGGTSWGIWMLGIAGVVGIVLPFLKNVEQLDKVVINTGSTTTKATKPAAKPAAKEEKAEKDTKKSSK